jgi:hypothetical protein
LYVKKMGSVRTDSEKKCALKKDKKYHRTEEGSALVECVVLDGFRWEGEKRLYERKRERQERPLNDAGPA